MAVKAKKVAKKAAKAAHKAKKSAKHAAKKAKKVNKKIAKHAAKVVAKAGKPSAKAGSALQAAKKDSDLVHKFLKLAAAQKGAPKAIIKVASKEQSALNTGITSA